MGLFHFLSDLSAVRPHELAAQGKASSISRPQMHSVAAQWKI